MRPYRQSVPVPAIASELPLTVLTLSLGCLLLSLLPV
jgi:hypothetical protein